MASRPPRSALDIAQARVAQAAENAAAMPLCAEAKAMFLELFGPGIRMTYAEENGRIVGQRGPTGVPFSLPPRIRKKAKAYR